MKREKVQHDLILLNLLCLIKPSRKYLTLEFSVRREINIMRQLCHPHIVRLFEVVETPSNVYVVMEYMDSGELFYYLTERGRLNEDEARRLFQQVYYICRPIQNPSKHIISSIASSCCKQGYLFFYVRTDNFRC